MPLRFTHSIDRRSVAFLTAAVAMVVGACSGCSPSESERAQARAHLMREVGVPDRTHAEDATASRTETTVDDLKKPWLADVQLPFERWEIQYVGNQPVGYTHRRVERSTSLGDGLLRLEANSHIRLPGKGAPIDQRIQLISIEREQGELVRLEGTVQVGSQSRHFEAHVRDGYIKLLTNTFGRGTTLSIPWKDENRGPFAIEQSLLRAPMKENESRELKYFDPIQGKSIEVQLQSLDYFETPTFDGKKERLLEIQIISRSGGSESSSRIWVDERGRGHKSYMPSMDMRSFLCDADSARVVADQSELASLPLRDVPMIGRGPVDYDSSPVTYRLETINFKSELQIPSRTNQVATQITPRKFQIAVYPSSFLDTAIDGLEMESAPSNNCTSPSVIVDSNHPQVQRFSQLLMQSKSSESPSTTPQRVALLRQGIAERIKTIPFDRDIANGRTTLARGQGDAFDHAVLLTALCRAESIPARMAIGLKYIPNKIPLSMTVHAWCEYYSDARWIPVDSTLETDAVPADRIKWAESALDSVNPYLQVLDLGKELNDLEVSTARFTLP